MYFFDYLILLLLTYILQQYLDVILTLPSFSCNRLVRQFLQPELCPNSSTGSARLAAAACLRDERLWVIEEHWPDAGWRTSKEYFLIHLARDKSTKKLMSWLTVNNGNLSHSIPSRNLQNVLDFLSKLNHPAILPAESYGHSPFGFLSIRMFVSEGSLRDQLHKSKPKESFLVKYGDKKGLVSGLDHFDLIRLVGRATLQALHLLHTIGLPHFGVSSSNIFVSADRGFILSDIENGLLGLPPMLWSFCVACKAIHTVEDVDVYCFAHTMYEVITGETLDTISIDKHQMALLPHQFREVLHSILSASALQSSIPTVADLLNDELFAGVRYVSGPEQISIPKNIKTTIDSARNKLQTALDTDKRLYQYALSSSKFQIYLKSEEHTKLRKHKPVVQAQSISHRPSSADVQEDVPGTNATPRVSPVLASPPPPPPPPPPSLSPPPPPPCPPTSTPDPGDRSAVFNSICAFDKSKLKKIETIDKSQPKI